MQHSLVKQPAGVATMETLLGLPARSTACWMAEEACSPAQIIMLLAAPPLISARCAEMHLYEGASVQESPETDRVLLRSISRH